MKLSYLPISALCLSSLLLSGCNTMMSKLDIPFYEELEEKPEAHHGAISVSEMLQRAKTGDDSHTEAVIEAAPLDLTFAKNQSRLSTTHKTRLRHYSEATAQKPLSVRCAPSMVSDSFTATTLAVSRCMKVSHFMQQLDVSVEAAVEPNMAPDHVILKLR